MKFEFSSSLQLAKIQTILSSIFKHGSIEAIKILQLQRQKALTPTRELSGLYQECRRNPVKVGRNLLYLDKVYFCCVNMQTCQASRVTTVQ